jgi:hypothetical protein
LKRSELHGSPLRPHPHLPTPNNSIDRVQVSNSYSLLNTGEYSLECDDASCVHSDVVSIHVDIPSRGHLGQLVRKVISSPAKSPKAIKDRQSAILQSSASGAGMVAKPWSKPPSPNVSTPTPIQPMVRHVKVLSDPQVPSFKEHVTLDVHLNEEGEVSVQLHLFDRLSHSVHTATQSPQVHNPTGHKCAKNGRIRKAYKVPAFPTLLDISITPQTFEEIMHLIQSYDILNGHPTPTPDSWTDAFSDVLGKNSHCPRHWSPVDNAFSHHWHDTNIYAFPPMEDESIFKTLHYHCLQQQASTNKGTSFKGVYVVPYRPSASYWKLTSNFQILKIYRAGDHILQSNANRGRSSKMTHVPSTIPMCILYDPGYTQPDNLMAFMSAMEQCSVAYDLLAQTQVPVMESFLDMNDGRVGQEPTIKPDLKPDPIPDDEKFWYGMENLRLYNMTHCSEPPTYFQDQTPKAPSLEDKVIASIQSAGKLTNILEQDDPDWHHVDEAIREHLRVIQDQQESSQDPSDYDPQMFNKTWLEGGYLPINHVRNIDQPYNDDACLVIKTKILGKYNNTALIDEGANKSVLNVDWYEHQGIDWREVFGVEESQASVVHMANQVPVPCYGTVTLPIEINGNRKVTFEQDFQLLRLGKSNYAQILGFDWKLTNHSVTSLPEYTLNLRKLKCIINAYPMPIRLYQLNTLPISSLDSCEEISPSQMTKDIKLLSARLRKLHVHVSPQSFLRQILVRPVKDDDYVPTPDNTNPTTWKVDDSLEIRAARLRQRIEDTFRQAYSDVLDGEPHGVNNSMPHKHIIELVEGAEPYSRKLKRLSPLEVELLNKYIKEMVDGGRIRPSDSPWGANVLFVPKPDGGYRCCQDYRELNKRIKHDTYPLPRIDVHMDMAQGTFWSKMDLLKGFYQLPMHEDSVKYTAFNTLVGKYEFLVMPMGLQSAPGSFMRAMNKVFDGLMWDPNVRQDSGILVYLDDILIFSQTEDQHMEILQCVLDRLRTYKLQCKFSKCTFAVTEIEYLGFKLSHQGVRMDPQKIAIVKNWSETPKNKSEIRAFLGIVNYLKRFCKGLAHHSAILSTWSSETCKDPWGEQHIVAMNHIKEMLCSDLVLASPKVDPLTKNYYPFTVITDASEVAVGAILLQQQGPSKEDTKVIGYASSKFKQAERNYSVHEKELLGVLLAVQQWNCFLEGSKFTVYTDHSSLVWLNKLENPSRRQARWVDVLQGHDFEVLYIKGIDNPADAFTRVPYLDSIVDENEEPIKSPFIMLRTLRTALRESGIQVKISPSKLDEWKEDHDRLLQHGSRLPPLYKSISEGYEADPNFSDINWINSHHITYRNGLFYKGNKVAVPDVQGVKIDILIEHHDSLMGGHLGISKSQEKVSRLFWWTNMHIDIENHVKTCPACQVSKHRNWKPQGRTFDHKPATAPMQVMHVDFAGPFRTKSPGGYNRIVIFTDAFTKLAIFVKCRTTLTSEGLADLYIEHVWKVYGRIAKLVSDNEPILCAEAWTHVHEKLGTKVKHISAYNAQANGAAEVMVKQLKAMLASYERQGLKWWKSLAACEKAYNDSVHSVTGYTPFYMMFGRHPLPDIHSLCEPEEEVLIQEFINTTQAELARVHEDAANKILQHTIRDTTKRNAKKSPTLDYKVGDYVFLETSRLKKAPVLAPLRSGPYAITKLVANGNAVFLEGFRHPFSVELITPALCFANGINPHLTQHVLHNDVITHNPPENANLPAVHNENPRVTNTLGEGNDVVTTDTEDAPSPSIPSVELEVEIEGVEDEHTPVQPQLIQEAIQDFMEDNEEVWAYQPEVRVVPSQPSLKPNKDIIRIRATPDQVLGVPSGILPIEQSEHVEAIVQIAAHVILPDQLPGDITEILAVDGRTINSAILLCQMSNGQQCRISTRQLLTILGKDRVGTLLNQSKSSLSNRVNYK